MELPAFDMRIFKAKLIYISGSKNDQTLIILKPGFVWLLCLLISFIGLLICTKSSPLYPFNDWADANAFFTMGKGMMSDKVLYRDLFDHKGPLLYFIYGLASLISSRSFLGVFVFEVFSFSLFLFFFYKALNLFCDYKNSLIYLPIISAFVLNLKSFVHGGSAEELSLPLVTISLFYLLDYFKHVFPRPISDRWILVNVIIAGCILWIKFSFLGFWVGWILSILICSLVNKQFHAIIKAGILFCFGILVATLPWLVYFGVNQSIYDWITSYLVINLTNYPIKMSLMAHIRFIFSAISGQVGVNPVFGAILWLGLLIFLFSKNFFSSVLLRVLTVLLAIFLSISIYAGGLRYLYYYLILAPLSVFGFISFDRYVLQKIGLRLSLKSSLTTLFLLLLVLSLYLSRFQANTYMLSWQKKDLVQYKFADLIAQTEAPTLLEYGTLDLGFYTTTGIIPNCRFFIRQNISQSRILLLADEQTRYVKEKMVDYLITRVPLDESEGQLNIPYLYENYRLLTTQNQLSEKVEYKYYLFQRIE